MEQYVAETTIEAGMDPRAVVASLVRRYPAAFGAEATFVLTAVAAALETPVVTGPEQFTAAQQGLFRAAAILAADIYAVENRLGMRCTCADILRFWQETGDQFFGAPIEEKPIDPARPGLAS